MIYVLTLFTAYVACWLGRDWLGTLLNVLMITLAFYVCVDFTALAGNKRNVQDVAAPDHADGFSTHGDEMILTIPRSN
ncbi:hypothetical protein VF14_18335 [Nostoc linckia z18]|uniref:Uncharacterized protein n=2 Tax=Nostoc linckia TaxID=92942 RepID=A0A9Q5Z988_NOSLI|nr:hypothetical protein [Nostoc linckia]PHJ53460.1 hypothetical protein VF02_37220 [Nostoc linckia z1]PHJ81972.1 hypothetical protein VF07_29195 [Nostoc linckia z6]PHJ92870.1 hypothetical protein VF04_27910 [Nostoc linckia z7]PHK00807.1 hypothetical protein VF08_23335 [Nostoc linckia z8]PHK09315.1 hypothetical protein VF09_15970 [Nostoc linckia z9]